MSNFIRPAGHALNFTRQFSASARRSNLNKVQLIGRVGAEPTRTEFEGGHVTNYTVATSEMKTDKEGNLVKRTQWHRVVFWKAPDWFSKVKKGDQVYVEGSLRYNEYVDKENVSRTKAEIHQTSFKLLSHPRSQSQEEEEE